METFKNHVKLEIMKNLKKAVLSIAFASALAALTGCATNQPSPKQGLFNGEYTNVTSYINQDGCDFSAGAKCEYLDLIVAFAVNDQVGGTRLLLGPQGTWHKEDQRYNLGATVERRGSEQFVRLERINADGDCAAIGQVPFAKTGKAVLPACGTYPEIRASWRVVTDFERMTERWSNNLLLLLTAMGGGELP